MIPERDWKWFGNPGHLICAQWCRFHLCTHVGDYLVSTVGEYVHPRHSAGNERDKATWLEANWLGEDIGWNRKYETMVFQAGEPCSVPECLCGIPDHDGRDIDCVGCNTRPEARDNHMAMCYKYAARAAGGDRESQ